MYQDEDSPVYEVIVPEGFRAGHKLYAELNGKDVEVVVPLGCGPGDVLHVGQPPKSGSSTPASSRREVTTLVVPDGSRPGDVLDVEVGGKQIQVTVPAGAEAGSLLEIEVASSSRTPSKHSTASRQSISASATQLEVQIPVGLECGDTFLIEVDAGRVVEVEVPQGGHPGETIIIDLIAPSASSTPRTKSKSDTSVTSTPRVIPNGRKRGNSFDVSTQPCAIDVTVPAGAKGGDVFKVFLDSKVVEVVTPSGARPGDVMTVDASFQSRISAGDLTPRQNSKSSVVDIVVPEGLQAGSMFLTEVSGKTIEVVIPLGAKSGDTITLDIPHSSDATPRFISKQSIVDVIVPDGCQAGDVFETNVYGKTVEVVVPDAAKPGDRKSVV